MVGWVGGFLEKSNSSVRTHNTKSMTAQSASNTMHKGMQLFMGTLKQPDGMSLLSASVLHCIHATHCLLACSNVLPAAL